MHTVKNIKLIVGIIAVLCIFGFKYIPAPEGLTPLSMEIAGIFIGTILLWLAVSITWPSLLCIFAFAITPLYTANQAISASIGSWVPTFVLFSTALCYILSKTGFLRRCAVWFITRPISKKSPWCFLALLFIAPLAIGSFMSPITDFIIFLPIVEQIFSELGYVKGDRVPKMITLCVLCFSSVSTMTTPIAHTFPILGMSLYSQLSGGNKINFVSFTIVGVLSSLILLVLVMLMLKYFFKPDLLKIQNVDTDFLLKGMKPMSKEEKIVVTVFLAVVMIWMAPGLIGGIMPQATRFLNGLGNAIPPMLGLIVLSLIKVEGKLIMNFAETMSKGVPWSSWLLVATTIMLGSAITNKDIGLTAWLGNMIAPAVSELPPIICVVLIVSFTVLITNFATNVVAVTLVCSVALPLVISGAVPNLNAPAMATVIGMGACVAMATPPSTAPAAIAVGTGWLDTGTMFKWGMLICAIAVIVLTFIAYPLALLLM